MLSLGFQRENNLNSALQRVPLGSVVEGEATLWFQVVAIAAQVLGVAPTFHDHAALVPADAEVVVAKGFDAAGRGAWWTGLHWPPDEFSHLVS